MRLLKLDENDEPILAKDYHRKRLPPYAILSHTWGADNEEVTFQDLQNGHAKQREGYQKIYFCGEQAKKDGLKYFWVDSCCIDKTNSTELSESINSMFRWYQNSQKCYVYLADVTVLKRNSNGDHSTYWHSSFENSRWHTRGWTLQEMIAPKQVEFFSRDGHSLGDRNDLEHALSRVSSVPLEALRGAPLSRFPPREKMKWAEHRKTTEIEDKAYCLLGIFNIFLPPIYGERDHAMVRLKEEVGRRWNVWNDNSSSALSNHLAAQSDGASSQRPTIAGIPNGHREKLMASLAFEQMESRHLSIKAAQQKTCDWFLAHPMYVAWSQHSKAEGQQDILWLSGKPGAGKSTLVKYALSQAQKAKSSEDILLSFFFNARGDELEKSTMGTYRSLLHQLLTEVPEQQHVLDRFEPSLLKSNRESMWSLENLEGMLSSAITSLGPRRIMCFIDALDECEEQEIMDMVEFWEDLGEQIFDHEVELLILFASRHYPAIEIRSGQRMILEDEAGHGGDLDKYIRKHMTAGKSALALELQSEISKKANGAFLWVVLAVNILNKEFSRGRIFAVKERLEEIPEKLTELFKDVLRRDNVNMGDFLLCLQWILFAKRPLRLEEFYFAMEAGLHARPDNQHEWTPQPWNEEEITNEDMHRFVLSSSKGLAEVTKGNEPTVQFIHESVPDFLIKDNGLVDLWPSLTNNVTSMAHEQLKHCCQVYLSINLPERGGAESSPPVSSPPAFSGWIHGSSSRRVGEDDWMYRPDPRRLKLAESYPFLKYASNNVLYHANEAARDILQTDFLARFPLLKWMEIANILEEHAFRRHGADLSLAYLLAHQGHARLLRTTAVRGLGPPSLKESYRYPLIVAFAMGHREAIESLLSHHDESYVEGILNDPGFGACYTIIRDDEHAVYWAILERNKALCHLLVELCPEDFQPKDHDGILATAAAQNWLGIVEVLLGKGHSSNDTISLPMGGGSALHQAAEKNYCQLAQVLLDKGASINKLAIGGDCGTPLHWAVSTRSVAMVELLLDKAAGLDVRDKDGLSPLHSAVRSSYKTYQVCGKDAFDTKIAQVLLNAGADIEARDKDGYTALHHASGSNGCLNAVTFLLEQGADSSAVTDRGSSSLWCALVGNNAQVADFLLKQKPNMSTHVHGAVALKFAIKNRRVDMAQQLLGDGVDVNWRSCTTPLEMASEMVENAAMVRMLIERGAMITNYARRCLAQTEQTDLLREPQSPIITQMPLEESTNALVIDSGGRDPGRTLHQSTPSALEERNLSSDARKSLKFAK